MSAVFAIASLSIASLSIRFRLLRFRLEIICIDILLSQACFANPHAHGLSSGTESAFPSWSFKQNGVDVLLVRQMRIRADTMQTIRDVHDARDTIWEEFRNLANDLSCEARLA